MTEYKSEVKKIYAPIGRVYERLADLNNLAVIQQGLDNPDAMERIKQQAGDKVKPEQLEQIVQKLRELQFDRDSVSGNTPIGTATLRIIEREPEKTIKFAAEGMPVAANMWIQLLPQNDNECAMRQLLHPPNGGQEARTRRRWPGTDAGILTLLETIHNS